MQGSQVSSLVTLLHSLPGPPSDAWVLVPGRHAEPRQSGCCMRVCTISADQTIPLDASMDAQQAAQLQANRKSDMHAFHCSCRGWISTPFADGRCWRGLWQASISSMTYSGASAGALANTTVT